MKNGQWWEGRKKTAAALHYSLCPVVRPVLCGLAVLLAHCRPVQPPRSNEAEASGDGGPSDQEPGL